MRESTVYRNSFLPVVMRLLATPILGLCSFALSLQLLGVIFNLALNLAQRGNSAIGSEEIIPEFTCAVSKGTDKFQGVQAQNNK